VVELRNSPTVEYQTAVLAFINCLILATPDLRERARVRSEFIGLRLLQVLGDLRLVHPAILNVGRAGSQRALDS